jgi:aconitate hydratase
MINGLGVLGWGVGGIEAEAAMLGQPISMLIPEVVGFKLTGDAAGGRHRDRPRAHRHRRCCARRAWSSKFVEFFGPGLDAPAARRPRDHRQHGAGVRRDLRLLPDRRRRRSTTCALTGRAAAQVALVEAYAKAQGLWPHDGAPRAGLHRHAGARPRRRSSPRWPGPKRPQDRVPLERRRCRRSSAQPMPNELGQEGADARTGAAPVTRARTSTLGHGDVVIAAITSLHQHLQPRRC